MSGLLLTMQGLGWLLPLLDITLFYVWQPAAHTNVIFKTFIHFDSLSHWGRVTHICVSKLTIIGSDNGLSPGRLQAIIWTNDVILLIGALGTTFTEILIKIQTFFTLKKSFESVVCAMAAI